MPDAQVAQIDTTHDSDPLKVSPLNREPEVAPQDGDALRRLVADGSVYGEASAAALTGVALRSGVAAKCSA